MTAEHTTGLASATKAIFYSDTRLILDPARIAVTAGLYLGLEFRDEEIDILSDPWVNIHHNMALANLIRLVANKYDWLKGWCVLGELCADSGLHPHILEDMQTCKYVYETLPRPISTRVPTCTNSRLKMTIVPATCSNSSPITRITHLGPKTLGGRAWKTCPRYTAIFKAWNGPHQLPMGPCPFYACTGVAKGILDDQTSNEDQMVFWIAQLLGVLVDYDLDVEHEKFKKLKEKGCIEGAKDIKGAIQSVAEMAVAKAKGAKLRGAAWAGLICLDQQTFNRVIQHRWITEATPSGPTASLTSALQHLTLNPNAHSNPKLPLATRAKKRKELRTSKISPTEFAIAAYTDCAALASFGYQSPQQFESSRVSMFVAVLIGNLYDYIYDRSSHSRISCLGYAIDASSHHVGALQALVVGVLDTTAAAIVSGVGGKVRELFYGDSALMTGSTWAVFNGRYRAWERMIKYLRILLRSGSPQATEILESVLNDQVILPSSDGGPLEGFFELGLSPDALRHAVARSSYTQVYDLPSPKGMLKRCNLPRPGLCSGCQVGFENALMRGNDTVEAVPGIPNSVISSDSVGISALISRCCRWAALDGREGCCEACVCKVGVWANEVSVSAVLEIMEWGSCLGLSPGGEGGDTRGAESGREEEKREWLLGNYVMGCTALSPVRLISVLGGFDAVADVVVERGAMGEGRDNVDC